MIRIPSNDYSQASLVKIIGEPPAGSHPDEWLPRASTWHQERLNWISEVATLRHALAERSAMTPALELLKMLSGGPVWDGNIPGKETRDELVRKGRVGRRDGWNYLTSDGIEMCVIAGFLKS